MQKEHHSTINQLIIILVSLFCLSSVESRQKFIKKPQSQSVMVGSNVNLECQVETPHGDVQWTKNFEAMGFDRSLPAYTRYRIIGDERRGQHTLQIRSVDLSDEAIYACEVSRYKNREHLQATASIYVFFPPSSVTINGSQNGSFIAEITQNELQLECTANNSRPEVEVYWTGFSQFESNITHYVLPLSEHFTTTVSRVRLRVSKNLNNRDIECISANTQSKKMTKKAQVKIFVTWPPDQPVISITPNTKYLIEGDHYKLSCSVEGGNPQPNLEWSRNNVSIQSGVNNQYSTKFYNNISRIANFQDDTAIYTCSVSSKYFKDSLHTSIQLNVYYGPDKATMSMDNIHIAGSKLVIPLVQNYTSPKNIQCISSISNPSPILNWWIDDNPVDEFHDQIKLFTNYIEIYPDKDMTRKQLTCSITNPKTNVTRIVSKQIEIPHQIENMQIIGQHVLVAGMSAQLKCVVNGGYPYPQIVWSNDGIIFNSSITNLNEQLSEAKLQWIVNKNDNNKEFICSATVKYKNMFKPIQMSVIPIVHFVPLINIADIKSSYNISEDLNLKCLTSASNPVTVLYMKMILLNKTEYQASEIASNVLQEKSGLISTSVFSFGVVDYYHHQAKIQCIGKTLINNSTIYTKRSMVLQVKHPPYFFASSQYVNVTKGHDVALLIHASAYPDAIEFRWFDPSMKEINSPSSRTAKNSDSLQIEKITLTQHGYYICHAENSIGFKRHYIFVNVQYEPQIAIKTQSKYVDPGISLLLTCKIDANPLILSAVNWLHNAHQINSSDTNFHISWLNSLFTLRILNVTLQNAGRYQCSAMNDIGNSSAFISILVKSAPQISRNSRHTNYASKITNHFAILSCYVEAIPNVQIQWKIDKFIPNMDKKQNTSAKYSTNIESRKNSIHISQLCVSNLTDEDFGRTYTCIAKNELGHDETRIFLLHQSIPDRPTKFEATNISIRSLELKWEPGYDGGSSQWFRIKYCTYHEDHCSFDDTKKEASYHRINSLDPGTRYLFAIKAINDFGESNWFPDKEFEIIMKDIHLPIFADVRYSQTKLPAFVLMVLCIISAALVILAIAIMSLGLRKQRRKCSSNLVESTTNTFETEANTVNYVNDIATSSISTDGWPKNVQLCDRFYDDDTEKPFLPRHAYNTMDFNDLMCRDTFPEYKGPNNLMYMNTVESPTIALFKDKKLAPYDNVGGNREHMIFTDPLMANRL